jgi:CO/xanthine dehydrogenase FAD-binding subunit
MMNIEKYYYASSLSDAYKVLSETSGAAVLGGCGYLRMGKRKITTAIDLSKLELDYIRENENEIEIGAMATLRSVETSDIIKKYFGGILAECVESIVGIQLRNTLTIGGTVAGRYPFSDILTSLMVLDVKVHFVNSGVVPLEEYMSGKSVKDIIEKISISKDGRIAAFESVRNSLTDYAMINAAVSRLNDEYKVVVGARPAKAVRSFECEKLLNSGAAVDDAAAAASAEMDFGDNVRAKSAYRKAVCPVLIKRAVKRLAE